MPMYKGEVYSQREKERSEPTPYTIRLNIIRHGEKDGPNEVTEKEDIPIRLTSKGKKQARARGIEFQTQGGVASGSTRQRTHESALHMAHANNPEVTGEESLEELEKKTGRRVWINYDLDMPFVKDDPDFKKIIEKYDQGILFKHFVEEDDTIARNGGDRSVSKYGKQVRKIASLIERFVRITQKMYLQKERAEDLGEEFDSEREQNMGAHGCGIEPFLAELIRHTLNEEEKRRFINAVPNAIAVSQGMSIDIQSFSKEESPLICIWFSVGKEGQEYVYDQDVPLSVIQDIVKDFSPHPKE